MPGGGAKPLKAVTLAGTSTWTGLRNRTKRAVQKIRTDTQLQCYAIAHGAVAYAVPTLSTETCKYVSGIFQMACQFVSDMFGTRINFISSEYDLGVATINNEVLTGLASVVAAAIVELRAASFGAPPGIGVIPDLSNIGDSLDAGQARAATARLAAANFTARQNEGIRARDRQLMDQRMEQLGKDGFISNTLSGVTKARYGRIAAVAAFGWMGVAEGFITYVIADLTTNGPMSKVARGVWEFIGRVPYLQDLLILIKRAMVLLLIENAIIYFIAQTVGYTPLDQTTVPESIFSLGGAGDAIKLQYDKFSSAAAALFSSPNPTPAIIQTMQTGLANAVAFFVGVTNQLTPGVLQISAEFQPPGMGPYPVLTRVDDGGRVPTDADLRKFVETYGDTPLSKFGRTERAWFESLLGGDSIYSHTTGGLFPIEFMEQNANQVLGNAETWKSIQSDVDPIAAYKFCSVSDYEAWTKRPWPRWTVSGRTPEGAAKGIAIDPLCLVNQMRPVRLCVTYVSAEVSAKLEPAEESLVRGVFGTNDTPSAIKRWRWEKRDEPRTLAELPKFIQQNIASEVVTVGVVESILFQEPRPYDGNIIRFIKWVVVAAIRAALHYSLYPADCLKTDTLDVAYPPNVGSTDRPIPVNVLLWRAWSRLRTRGVQTSRWQDDESLGILLKSDPSTEHIASLGKDAFLELMGKMKAIQTDEGRRGVMESMLNTEPIVFDKSLRETVSICRYFLYLLIPDEYRGPNDVFIGGIYSSVVFENMPGYCPMCGKNTRTFRWIAKGDSTITGLTLPDPGSVNYNKQEYKDFCANLFRGDGVEEGCLKCYMERGVKMIKGASTPDEAQRVSMNLARKMDEGDTLSDKTLTLAKQQVRRLLAK
tara:strand:- start:322 stop:2946 length:2625 start_codon:yes stop_codon:yes gene_type:complete